MCSLIIAHQFWMTSYHISIVYNTNIIKGSDCKIMMGYLINADFGVHRLCIIKLLQYQYSIQYLLAAMSKTSLTCVFCMLTFENMDISIWFLVLQIFLLQKCWLLCAMHYGRADLRAFSKWLPVYATDWDCIIKFILTVFFRYSGLKT